MKKQKKETAIEELKRGFAIILEDINSKLDLVLEGHGARLDSLDKNLLEFKGEMHEFKGEMHEFKDEMYNFKSDTTSNFKSIFKYLSRFDDELQDLKKEIVKLNITLTDKADISILEALNKRVQGVEMVLKKLNTA